MYVCMMYVGTVLVLQMGRPSRCRAGQIQNIYLLYHLSSALPTLPTRPIYLIPTGPWLAPNLAPPRAPPLENNKLELEHVVVCNR